MFPFYTDEWNYLFTMRYDEDKPNLGLVKDMEFFIENAIFTHSIFHDRIAKTCNLKYYDISRPRDRTPGSVTKAMVTGDWIFYYSLRALSQNLF
jgi:hypothetical protein